MSNLSYGDLLNLAKIAGFSGKDDDIAAAVALAESGGNPRAHNSTPPDDSYGLWQINMLGAMGPARRKQFGISSNDKLYDPEINAMAAYKIFRASGWNAWTTYTSGKYKQYMHGSTIGNAAGGAVEAVKDSVLPDITGPVNALGKSLFTGVANVTGIIVAMTCLVLGVVILMRNVVPAGKAVKVVSKAVAS